MYIEKISKEAKEKFIQDYVDNLNIQKHGRTEIQLAQELEEMKKDEKMKHRIYNYSSCFHGLYHVLDYGKDEIFEETKTILKQLEEQNILVKLYYYTDEDMIHTYSYQKAIIAAFGDTSVNVFDVCVGTRSSYPWAMKNAVEHIDKNIGKILITRDLKVNKEYIKTFMFPELEKEDKKNGTNLVEGYKKSLTKEFEQKKNIVNNKFNETMKDLGL